jgi:hypothetical protein
MYAAITGDIIGSKRIDSFKRDELNKLLLEDFQKLNKFTKLRFPFEFLRGDSFQGVSADIENALKVALIIKSIFKKNLEALSSRHGSTNARVLKNMLHAEIGVYTITSTSEFLLVLEKLNI